MKTPSYYAGIDIGSEDITVGVYTKEMSSLISHSFDNNKNGYLKFLSWLNKNKFVPKKTVICIENTGVYSEGILYFLFEQGFKVALESPLHLKKTFRLRQKDDKTDARQIAEYAFRYLDKLRFWQPPAEILELINTLLTLREQYVAQNTAEKNLSKSLSRKKIKSSFTLKMLKKSIKERDKKIIEIEKELKDLVNKDPDIKDKISRIESIKSIGFLFAVNFFCVTDGFSMRHNPKQLTSYLGICPHDYESGKTVFRKPRSKGFGPARIRKLLYLAAMSIIQHDATMKKYYFRKLAEGKPRKLVLNNIENKIIKIVCAIINSENSYISGYRSINPARL